MKKKLLLLVAIIFAIALLGTIVFATETDPNDGIMLLDETLNPTVDAESLQNTELVGEDNDMGMTEDYTIPAEWARGMENYDQKELVGKDIFQSENKIQVSSLEVDGNVFYVGKEVLINDMVVYGDIFIAGEYIDIQNIYASGNIYVAGQDIAISRSDIVGNMYVAGETVSIKSSSAQDVFGASSNCLLDEGNIINRNLNFGAATISIDNTSISRNANISSDKLNIGSSTMIAETLNHYSKNEAEIADGATIVNTNKIASTGDLSSNSKSKSLIYNVVSSTLQAVFVCGFIFLFAKGFMKKQKVENVFKHIAINTAKGLLCAIVIPVVAILLLCTGMAFGLCFAVLAIYFVIFIISLSVVSITISTALTKNKEMNTWKYYGITILTAFVISVLAQIPGLGTLISIVVGLAGMGSIFSSLKNKKEVEEV